MKKLFTIMLAVVLVFSFTLSVMADNGNAKGLSTAPGQAANFTKGVTTIVTSTSRDVNSTITSTVVSDPVIISIVPKSETTSVVTGTVIGTSTERHPVHEWTRVITATTTETTITAKTWDEITTATTTTVTETPVITTYTTVNTLMHQGAPGSNGKVISNTSVTTESKKYGTPVVVSTTIDYKTVNGEVKTTSEKEYSTLTTEGEWLKADGTPSTEPQGGKK